MSFIGKAVLTMAVAGVCSVSLGAEKPAATPAPATAASQPATQAKALTPYDQLVEAYLNNDFETIASALKTLTMSVNNRKLTPDERINVEYIRKAAEQQRPKWWAHTKAASGTSFPSVIWGKSLMTNYIPQDGMGVQGTFVRDGKLMTVVAWRPTYVDNPRPADGAIAKRLKVTKGDIGEAVVWHELGHNFISSQLSLDAARELYTKHEILYSHLQEFYADMTSVHHATPRARRVALILRLDPLDPPYGKYDEIEPHTRAAHAIGSAFLFEVLSDRAKWPNVHLPAAVPEQDVELQTIIYMYENFTADWTLNEDKMLRDWAYKVVRTQGDQIFRSKGMIPLAEKNMFSLMEAQDREHQKKRDAWVKERLNAAIAKGAVDKPLPKPKDVVKVNGRVIKMGGQRIEVPSY